MVLEHTQFIDHCEFDLHFWFVEDNRWSVIWRDEQDDNGQGMGMGIRMYLGPGKDRPTVDPDPVLPGPPIVIVDNPEPEPDPTPEPQDCSNNIQGTCPGNGPWNFNIHTFSNSKGTWPAHMKERFKAGAFVAGKLMNDGNTDACLSQYQASDFTSTTWSSTGLTSKPSGAAFFDHLYAGREISWATESGGTDNQADVKFIYWDNSKSCSVLASAGVPGSSISFSSCWYSSSIRSPSTTASNMMHEWSHNMGYGHTCACQASYPYRVGGCVSKFTMWNSEARSTFPDGNW